MEFTSSSFFVTLPSNASKDLFPSNKVGEYRVKLARPIQLKHDYEIALSEIHYPRTWDTLPAQCNKLWYSNGSGLIEKCIDPGYYESIDKMIQQIHKAINPHPNHAGPNNPNAGTGIIISYNEITRHVKVYIRDGFALKLGDGIAQILGLPIMEEMNQTMVAPEAVDLNRGLTALYIYCDLCEPQIVGDTLAPLLRIVDIKGKDGETVLKNCNPPQYVPLRKKTLDVIEINICDDTGQISFTSGKLICKLHIRLRQPSLFL